MFNWFKKKPAAPDFASLNSQEKVETAAQQGDLAPMLLVPEEFGGQPSGPNLVFVPAWAVEQKRWIDTGTVMPLAESGKVSQYSAKPAYKGDSFVPASITIRAHEPAEFTATIEIW